MKFFKDENEFKVFVMRRMMEEAWHVQRFNDSSITPGVPDLNGERAYEEKRGYHEASASVWAELKCVKKKFAADDRLKLQHPVTAQQKNWLLARGRRNVSHCGVLVAFRTTAGDYVGWCPITQWEGQLANWDMRSWVMSCHTASLEWIAACEVTILDLLLGRLLPGWRGLKP